MKNILPEEHMKQLEEIGHVSNYQLETILEETDIQGVDMQKLHEQLERHGVHVTETAPPHLPRHPKTPESDPHPEKEENKLNK